MNLVVDILALGLTHVGVGIPPEYMSPFVTTCPEVVQCATKDDEADKSFGWSLALVLQLFMRPVTEGSTFAMKVIINNYVESLYEAAHLRRTTHLHVRVRGRDGHRFVLFVCFAPATVAMYDAARVVGGILTT